MSNRRSIADFPRNEVGLVDEFIGTAYDTVKSVYDNLPEIQRLDGVLEEIPELAEKVAKEVVDSVVEDAMVPARAELNEAVEKAQDWAESSTNPSPTDPAAKSAKSWAEDAGSAAVEASNIIQGGVTDVTNLVALGTQQVNTATASGKAEIQQAMVGMDQYVSDAEAARDAAMLSGKIFATMAEGLAATAEGGFFSVLSTNPSEYTLLYQKVSGAAVFKIAYPSKASVDEVKGLIAQLDTTITDVAFSFEDTAHFVLMKLMANGNLEMLKAIIANTEGNGIEIAGSDGFVASRLGMGSSEINGLSIQFDNAPGIFFTDSFGFIVGKITNDGVFLGLDKGTGSTGSLHIPFAALNAQVRTDYIQIIEYGQSLSRGVQSKPAVSTTQQYQNVMLKSGVKVRSSEGSYDASAFVPLIETSNDVSSEGETPVTAICNGITRRAVENGELASRWKMVGTSPGRSGASVEQLSPKYTGNTHDFEDMVKTIMDTYSLATSMGGTYSVWAYSWDQGESNHLDQWERSTYEYGQLQLNLFDRLTDEILKAGIQTFRPYLCTYQVAAHRRYGRDDITIAAVQWRLSRERDDVILAAPCYIFPVAADRLHLTNEGSWLLGEYKSRAIYDTMIRRSGKWRPLEPIDVDWNSTHIDVKFHVPMGRLVLDDALATLTRNFGFDVWDNENQLIPTAISSVVVTSRDTVRITLTNPAPNMATLSYGRGRSGDASASGPTEGARGNLRDTHGDSDIVESPLGNFFALHNACVMFNYSRKYGF